LEELVTIELFGKPYTFKAESEVKKAKEVADFLAKEVSRVESQQFGGSSTASDLTTLMLAALNIAHQNMELEKNYSKFRQDIAERSAKLIRKIDEHVQEMETFVTS
jgi:cell division protein ZapA (FtsZ GTPase activity inhibitor)